MDNINSSKIIDYDFKPTETLPMYRLYSSMLGRWNEKAFGSDARGIFTSSNPVFGIGTPRETYARHGMHFSYPPGTKGRILRTWDFLFSKDPDQRFKNEFGYYPSGKPARLITIHPDPNAKVGIVVTQGNSNGYEPLTINDPELFRNLPKSIDRNPKRGQVDILYHLHLDFGGKPYFQEWVIINPKSIKWFSADPDAARDVITSTLDKMENKMELDSFSPQRLFFSKPLPHNFKEILKNFLSSGTDGIPRSFLRGKMIPESIERSECLEGMLSEHIVGN